MVNSGIILTIAYPDTVVKLSQEWFAPFLRFFGVGSKNYVRAGHAALVLIEKATGKLNYYDFGRYIVPEPYGRVRSSETDNELHLPFNAEIVNNSIKNLDYILNYLATHPKLTHGEGKMLASVCADVDYKKAQSFILNLQNEEAVRYAAFKRNASNCARFVTDTLIASVTDVQRVDRLKKLKRFTPSTVDNVLLSDTENHIYQVSNVGEISTFKGSKQRENLRCFLDRLKDHQSSLEGNLQEKMVPGLSEKAQWLSGIGSGAWFEIYKTEQDAVFRFRRISPYGTVDCDAEFSVDHDGFSVDSAYEFLPFSNCKSFQIKQNDIIFKFKRTEPSSL